MWRLNGYYEKRAIVSPDTRGISANSERTQADLIRFYGADPAKIAVIYNGVDTERFTPDNRRFRSAIRRRYSIAEDALVVLFVGKYRRTGLATIIDALGKLRDPRLHLLAVGRGDVDHYKQLAASAGIVGRATFAPPARDIEQVFGAADIFAFPTYYEPFGVVVTEAMASGLPAITSRRAGASELIEDGRSGLLLEQPGDAQELAEKISLLVSNSALRRAMSRNARPAASQYNWDDVAADTLELYHKSLNRMPEAVKPAT